jgi:hypothetical protein
LLHSPEDSHTVSRLEKLFCRTHVQNFLINLTDELLTKFFTTISIENIQKLILQLENTNQKARDLNSHFDMRVKMWNAGLFADRMVLPSLIEVEARAVAAILTVRYRLHFYPKDDQPEKNEQILFR